MLPIHYAVLKNNLDMVTWLVKNKALEIAMKKVCPKKPLSSQLRLRLHKYKDNSNKNEAG